MNTLTEHDRKLADTLRSLALPPPARPLDPPAKSHRRIVPFSGLLVLGTVALVAAFRLLASPPVSPNQKTLFGSETAGVSSVEAPAVQRTDVSLAKREPAATIREVTGSGYVIAPRSTRVFSKYAGQITHVAVELGDHVDAGQVLVTLDDVSARFALEQANIARTSAELVLAARRISRDQAQSALRRKEALAGIVSKQEAEDARAAWESAQNTVAQAQQDLDKAAVAVRIAEEQVDALTVRAPISGVVLQIAAHVGDTVLARVDSVREGQSLLTIADMTSLVIDADVAETHFATLRPGLSGEAVLDGFPDRPFPVAVTRLAPVVSSEKGTITLRFAPTAPPEGLRPGMAARIRMTTSDSQSRAAGQ